jgi:hypothetical protein
MWTYGPDAPHWRSAATPLSVPTVAAARYRRTNPGWRLTQPLVGMRLCGFLR